MGDFTTKGGPALASDGIPTIGAASDPEHESAALRPRIDGFDLKEKLGEGGEGCVYRALERYSGREVAIKIVHATQASSEARFRRQIELAASLEHANVVRVYGCGTSPCYYFSMQRVKGGVTLDEFVENANLGANDKLRLFLKVCEGISHAHRRLVVHLDLKPRNILVDSDGNPHVLDFGLAMKLSEDGGWEYSEIGGTPAYMSPEQARGELARDNAVASDTYSLGVILYKLLTGRFPHDVTGSNSEVMQRVANEPIQPPLKANPRLPWELAAMLERVLAAKPRARYHSVGELVHEVQNYLAGNPLRAVTESAKHPKVYRFRKGLWKHRRGVTLTVWILGIIAAVTALGYVNVARQRNFAQSQSDKLRISERRAELGRAELLVSQGDLLGDAGKWEQAKESYSQARDVFVSLQESPKAAELGTWKAYRQAPPPLSVIRVGDEVMGVALTRDACRAVTVSPTGQLCVWDSLTGARIGDVIEAAHGQVILSVCLASTGDLALIGSEDSTARLIDLKTGVVIAMHHEPGQWITRVALAPGDKRALTVAMRNANDLTSNENNSLSIWSLPDGAIQSSVQSNGQVVCAAFSPDGSIIATGGRELAFWDASTLRKLITPLGGGNILSLAFSADGKQLATGGSDAVLRLWEVATGRQVLAMPTGAAAVNSVAFSRDGRAIISIGNDGVLQTWNRYTGAELTSVSLPGEGVKASVLCSDGDVVARIAADNTGAKQAVTFWSTVPPVEVRRIARADGAIHDVRFLFDGRVIVAASSRGLKLWDVPSDQPLDFPTTQPTAAADAIAVTSAGDRLALISGSKLFLLQAATGNVIKGIDLERSPNSPAVLAFSPDGSTLVAPGAKFSLSVRDGRTLEEKGQLGHIAPVTAVAFSGDSKRVITGGRDSAVRLWNAATMQLVRRMTGHLDAVNAVAFSPEEPFTFSAGGNSDIEAGHADFDVRKWNLESGECAAKFTGHKARVRALALNADGSILVSASDDKTLKLWRTKDGRELATLSGHAAPVVAVSFSADGNSILSAGEDRAVFLWDLGAVDRRHDLKDQPGERFAFLGADAWAANILNGDRAGQKKMSHLTLARCLWKLGQTDRALEEMSAAADAREAPADYLALCLRTLSAQHD